MHTECIFYKVYNVYYKCVRPSGKVSISEKMLMLWKHWQK